MRATTMPFVKGQSGNPGGRPKEDPEVRRLCELHTPEAISTLAEIMKNKKYQASARVSAAAHILRKTLPDLSAIDGQVNTTCRNVIMVPEPLSIEEWEQKYGNNGKPLEAR
jgi:hypothetical protein